MANSIPTLGAALRGPRDRRSEIKFKLNERADEPYPEALWTEKVEAVWQSSTTKWAAKDRARGLRRPSVVLVEGAPLARTSGLAEVHRAGTHLQSVRATTP